VNSVKERSVAGLIYGPEIHYLDHLGPLCDLLGIPLIVTEEAIAIAASQYYPSLNVVFLDYLSVGQHLIADYEIIFYSTPRLVFDEVFFFLQKMAGKKVHTIWCPHGNSDKGRTTRFMEALHQEEVALVYGQQLIDFLKKKEVFDNLLSCVVTGNFRQAYYIQNQSFYDTLAEKEVFSQLPSSEKIVLYAPTWKDYEQSTSFFEAVDPLIAQLPKKWSLVIKIHPNLLLQQESQVNSIIDQYKEDPRILFLTNFPPIYPLLNRIDIYIGDMSSIGYDFLSFDRPLFFLNQNMRDSGHDSGLYLFRSGVEIQPDQYDKIYPMIQKSLESQLHDFSKIRKEVYAYAFGPHKPLDTLVQEIRASYAHFPTTPSSSY